MAVKLRLMRMGKKKHPTYRVVAADSRSPRDGRFIELIGRYDPHHEPSVVEIDNDRANYWLGVGAQPTAAVRKLLEISGAWTRFAMARGDIHVVDASPPESKGRPSGTAPEPEPVAEEPVAETPAPEESAPQESAPEESAATEPAPEQPGTQEPVAGEPMAGEPVAAEPVAAEPDQEPVAGEASDETATTEEA